MLIHGLVPWGIVSAGDKTPARMHRLGNARVCKAGGPRTVNGRCAAKVYCGPFPDKYCRMLFYSLVDTPACLLKRYSSIYPKRDFRI